MPNDPGPSSWLEKNYRQFLDGLEQVGTGEAKRLAQGQLAVRVDRPKVPTINVPAWDDIIRLGPRPTLTDEDWRIQKHFERARLPSPLTEEKQQAIADRRAMVERIRNSALPEYQQGVAAMATAVDNVQDAALTASVAGRILIPAVGRLGPYIAPAVLALGNLATLLNWIGLGVYLFGIAYTLACQGPRAAIANAAVPHLAGYAFKGLRGVLPRQRGIPMPAGRGPKPGHLAAMAWGTASGRAIVNATGTRWAGLRISFGEALQAAQVASDLTGYGISLGALMGFIGETTYANQRLAQGEKVRVRSPYVNHLYDELTRPLTSRLGRGAAWHREQCCRALASAPFVLRDPELWGDTLYALTWLVVYTSVEPLAWDTQGIRWRDQIIANADAEWTAWDTRDLTTRGALEEHGIDPDAASSWPLPGSPRTITTSQLVLELGPEIARALDRWTLAAPTDPLRRFVGELAMKTTERLWAWLEDSRDYPRWSITPATAVFESLIREARWPIASDPPELLQKAWTQSELYVTTTGNKQIDQPELDRIWEHAGTPLLRLLPDTAPMPPEWFVPYDEQTSESADVAYGQTVSEARARLQPPIER
jgi:hypothetical protein